MLVSVLILGCILQQPNPSTSPSPRNDRPNDTESQEQRTKVGPKPRALPATSVSSAVSQPSHDDERNGNSDHGTYIKKVLAPDVLPQWLLFIAGAIGILFAYKTLVAVEAQTRAAKAAANAANATTNAMMDIEAALLFIEDVQFWPDPKGAYFSYRIGLTGKTNARIFFENSRMSIGDSQDAPSDVSIYDTQSGDLPVEHIVAPDTPNSPMVFGGYFPNHRPITDQELAAISAGQQYLWACGMFRYRDTFKRAWERRFCYVYESIPVHSHFCIGGPLEYNRLTKYKAK
jgi:hypothetical protein